MANQPAKKIIVAYIPVLHRGYLKFFVDNKSATELYVLGKDLIKLEDYLRKDLRALKPQDAIKMAKATNLFNKVSELNRTNFKVIDTLGRQIIMPDEDISRELAKKIKKAKVSFKPVFLRWDRDNVEKVKASGLRTTFMPKHLRLMSQAFAASAESSDIWRRIGAILVTSKNKKIGPVSNKSEPHIYSAMMEGDPRNIYNRGVNIETSLFTHAEAALIAQCAKAGISTNDASLYVTTFPCPACAKLVARSGIKKLYFAEGYAVLDGKRVLESYGVKIIKVKMFKKPKKDNSFVPYKKS